MAALLLAAPAALLPALILLGRYERRALEPAQGERRAAQVQAVPIQAVEPVLRVDVNTAD